MSVFVPDLRRQLVTTTAQKAGPLGPGASRLLTEYPLSMLMKRSPQEKIRQALMLGRQNPWIHAAERVVTDRASTAKWHLEDVDDNEIDDTATDPDILRVRKLLEQPQANLTIGRKMTGREMRALTYRHMGLAGVGFWFLDEIDGMGIPANLLYIRPDRMYPFDDEKGNLLYWVLDPTPQGGGTRLELKEVLQFNLAPPDEGHYGIGLVESALMKAQLSLSTDSHAASVLAAGGRLAGIISPKTGSIDADPIYEQMVLDARTITEQPDAAKRLQIIRAPVDFTSTAMTMADARIIDMMSLTRDDLLAIWGVPSSQIGITQSRGLNSGDSQNYEEAALWQNGVNPRTIAFAEVIQFQFLDPMAPGVVLEYEIESPSFDDETPRYDIAQKALNQPLRNGERREILGMDPLGPDVINPETGLPFDDEVWMPMNMVRAFVAQEEGQPRPVPQAPPAPPPAPAPGSTATRAAGETAPPPPPGVGKAGLGGPRPAVKPLHDSLVRMRTTIDGKMTPKLKRSVDAFLAEQRRDIAARIREHAAHLEQNPGDSSVWFPAAKYDKALADALRPGLTTVAGTVSSHISEALPAAKADLVPRINTMVRDRVADIIAQGGTMDEIAEQVETMDIDEVKAYLDEDDRGTVVDIAPQFIGKFAGLSPVVAAMLKAAIEYGEREPVTPIVNVTTPDVHVDAPVIVNNLPAAEPPIVTVEAQKAAMMPDIIVNVPQQPAPVVNVTLPPERAKRVVYDNKTGKISEVRPE